MRESEEEVVNPSYAHKMFGAANPLRPLRGKPTRNEGRLAADPGLVDATLRDGEKESLNDPHRLQDAGGEFLRRFHVLPDHPRALLATDQQLAGQAILAKWSARFALDLRLPPRVDPQPPPTEL